MSTKMNKSKINKKKQETNGRGYIIIGILSILAAIITIIGYNGKDLVSRIQSKKPHDDFPILVYKYQSNYYDAFLLKKNDYKSILDIKNSSNYNINNLDIKVLCYKISDAPISSSFFIKPYYINEKEYHLMHVFGNQSLEKNYLLKLDISKIINDFMYANKIPKEFLFPIENKSTNYIEFGESQSNLVYLDFPDIEDDVMRLTPDNYEYRRGFLLKIIVNYNINDYQYTDLLAGGIYYPTLLNNGNYYSGKFVIDYFSKMTFSFVKYKENNTKLIKGIQNNISTFNHNPSIFMLVRSQAKTKINKRKENESIYTIKTTANNGCR